MALLHGGADDNTTLRVASFSCYLDTTKDNNSLHKISAQHYPPKDTTLRVDSFNTPFTFPQQPPTKDEITLFGAKNYFTIKSSPSQNKQRKTARKRILFPGFRCRGPCFNRKDVVVPAANVKTPSPPRNEAASVEESRRSIEVFGSGAAGLGGGEIAKNLERKLSMLTWDAIPKAKNLPTSTVGSFCDDVASEASSDLFEIDKVSGSVNPNLRDDVSMSPSSYYAPSEASIQWSVVTADYYPPNSDYSEEGVDVKYQGKECSLSKSQATHKILKTRS